MGLIDGLDLVLNASRRMWLNILAKDGLILILSDG